MAQAHIYPNVFAETLERVRQASRAALSPDADMSRVVVEPPRDTSHGDVATNAAMVLAKAARRNPRELAESIASHLRGDQTIEKIDIAGPGFINLTLSSGVWAQELRRAIAVGADYGRGVAKSEPVHV